MNISFLGGACEIGASCMLLRIKNNNILLDCGIRQGSSKDILPNFRMIQEMGGIDAIIISHAHMDHTGALPLISKEYPFARIYMNNMTKDLIRVLLYDSLKIMNNREAEIPLYAEPDVENMLNRIVTLNYYLEFEILEGLKIVFYSAGHIAGASAVYIISEGGTVFYSGDFSTFSQRAVGGAKIPKLRPDVAIFESTYGDKLHSNREMEEGRLIELSGECIKNGGKMLIPAFALGRAQEIILILKKAMNTGKLKKTMVYVDGMIRQINIIHKNNPLYLKSDLGKKILRGVEPFYDDNIKMIENKEKREEIVLNSEACIIISSSGMLTGGPSQFYAEKIASMENGYIVVSGYQDEESPGRKLLNLAEAAEEDRILQIGGKSIPVKCKIERVGLSAHGDKSEIKALVNLLSPKNIFLVHGEKTVIESLAKEIAVETRGRVYAPMCGESIDLEIYNPRKQLKKELHFLMKKKEALCEDNLSELWAVIQDNYCECFFTVEQIGMIWTGSSFLNNEDIENLQKLLIESVYFENDLRRFFMFKAVSKEEALEALKPKELKQNDITDIVFKFFNEYKYKKSGLILEEKKVILYFDFPKAVEISIHNKMESFEEETSWSVQINKQCNNTATENLITTLFKDDKIKKISHMYNENKIMVTVDSAMDKDYEEEKVQFKGITGMNLYIKNNFQSAETSVAISLAEVIKPDKGLEIMEQNEAFNYIDKCFQREKFMPYKKGIKSDASSKYIELSFISPVIGRTYEEKIEGIAKSTGWNMSISSSVNQNEILKIAIRLCHELGITLRKNPSFNLATYKVTLRVEKIDVKGLEKVKEEFDMLTGCSLEWN